MTQQSFPLPFKSCQEIFDETANYLFEQQEPSAAVGDGGRTYCQYRRNDGNCCAVGYWVPPDAYLPEWDEDRGAAIREILADAEDGPLMVTALALSGVNAREPDVVDVLEMLQFVHDQAESLHFTQEGLRVVGPFETRHAYLHGTLAYAAAKLGLRYESRGSSAT
jgi:hypothetical protein